MHRYNYGGYPSVTPGTKRIKIMPGVPTMPISP
jgi:hypothetical protein